MYAMTLEALPLSHGILLAGGTIAITLVSRLAESRAAAPVALIAIASFYVVFAVEAQSATWVVTLTASLFVLMALLAYRTSLWFAVVGLALHAAYDLFSPQFDVASPEPEWWPMFCLAYDAVLAIAFAWWILNNRLNTHPREEM